MKLAAIEAVVQALDQRGVRFMVVGGLAVVAHGYVRYTADMDLVIQLKPDNIAAAFEALSTAGYRPLVPVTAEQFGDDRQRNAWIEQKGMQVLNFWSDQFPQMYIDVFVYEPFDFDAEYARALVDELAPGLVLRFPALDTLLQMKRTAGRSKDLIDVEYLQKDRS